MSGGWLREGREFWRSAIWPIFWWLQFLLTNRPLWSPDSQELTEYGVWLAGQVGNRTAYPSLKITDWSKLVSTALRGKECFNIELLRWPFRRRILKRNSFDRRSWSLKREHCIHRVTTEGHSLIRSSSSALHRFQQNHKTAKGCHRKWADDVDDVTSFNCRHVHVSIFRLLPVCVLLCCSSKRSH